MRPALDGCGPSPIDTPTVRPVLGVDWADAVPKWLEAVGTAGALLLGMVLLGIQLRNGVRSQAMLVGFPVHPR